jgi:hypothetical protein
MLKFEEEINTHIKGVWERQLTKKKPNVSNNAILKTIYAKNPFINNDVEHKQFL